ncbi:hypothetical protein GCM10027443_18060 [Pontibacter brevis]
MNVSTFTRHPQTSSFYKSKQPKQPFNPDHIGRVKFFDTIKGYGYTSTDFGGDVYFKARNVCSMPVQVNDEVCFHLNASKRYPSRLEAVALRKVYRSKDGHPIFNRVNSHLHTGIESILEDVTRQVNCQGRGYVQEEVNFNYNLGENILVRLNAEDSVVYAIRKGRSGYTKFVLNREPEECNTATIVLKKVEVGYLIITAYIGKISAPEPWDKNATSASLPFWENHALIYGHEDVYEDTLTDVCPWRLRTAA